MRTSCENAFNFNHPSSFFVRQLVNFPKQRESLPANIIVVYHEPRNYYAKFNGSVN